MVTLEALMSAPESQDFERGISVRCVRISSFC